ncbi:tRNA preQ1(34) S-adenosylmethionine ribosyltransferase-isomerase QueA [Patescibacteria group bacterium]
MKITEFDYKLPKELIAQKPIEPRDHSRLLVLDRKNNTIEHRHFFEIGKYLKKGDVLVCNQSEVISAKISGYKIIDNKKSAKLDLLLLNSNNKGLWEFLVKPIKRIKVGSEILIEKDDHKLKAIVEEILEDGIALLRFKESDETVLNFFDKYGDIPLPPYIQNQKIKRSQYQTIYAKRLGSVAAPTAGFHFTNDLIKKLKRKGIQFVFVTLHVGLGTFQPVRNDKIENHKMHSEKFELNKDNAEILNKARKNKQRIIPVGTTSVRVLESSFKNDKFISQTIETDIFIYPGYQFKTVDAMITNFHLPKSTLLMLVSAFTGKELIDKAYLEAIKEKYRFYSFGDAMLIL